MRSQEQRGTKRGTNIAGKHGPAIKSHEPGHVNTLHEIKNETTLTPANT